MSGPQPMKWIQAWWGHQPMKCTMSVYCWTTSYCRTPLRWRHNDHAGVSNHQPRGCLLNRLFRRKSKKTSKLRVTGLCAGNSPGTGEFPAQMASYAENVSIWWRHHGCELTCIQKQDINRLGPHHVSITHYRCKRHTLYMLRWSQIGI